MECVYCLNTDMMVLFVSVLNTSSGALIFSNLNVLQYNMDSPKPSSLSAAIPDTHPPLPHNLAGLYPGPCTNPDPGT